MNFRGMLLLIFDQVMRCMLPPNEQLRSLEERRLTSLLLCGGWLAPAAVLLG